MVIYEVNLEVKAEIYNDYYPWLLEHTKQMLAFTGFRSVEIGQIIDHTEKDKKCVRICYLVDSYDDLQHYFNHHATQMRLEGLEKFGNGFNATRRIILDPIVFSESMT